MANLMKQGLDYKFHLKDLHLYSQKLKFKDINWVLKRTALGKVIPTDKEREKKLIKESYLNKLYEELKNTDWSKTEIYNQYSNKSIKDETIYSELELKYLLSSLSSMVNEYNDEEFNQKEGILILE